MQLTAQLKPTEELKSLEGFIGEPVGRLNFKDNVHITSKMLNKSLIELTYNKDWKAWSDGEYEYSLDWLTNITVSDEKLKLGLEVNNNKLTVEVLFLDLPYGIYEYKNFMIDVSNDTEIDKNYLSIGNIRKQATYTFPSHKALTKWIRNLIKCK